MANVKKISQLPQAETLTESTNIVIEDAGETKRLPANLAIPSGVVKSVNGVEPDAEGNVEVQVGVTSWNDLQDRPFGDEKKIYAWDGVLDGRDTFKDGLFVKISDDTPTADELKKMQRYIDGELNGLVGDYSVTSNETCAYDGIAGFIVVCYATTITYFRNEIEVPSTGMYLNTGYAGTTIVAESVKQLDPKYIPESAHYLTDANGVQYKLTVGTDGTLSAVAVE